MAKLEDKAETRGASELEPEGPWLVVVGSSAGGIEALSAFVATLPAGFTATVVIAQHLDPTRPSQLAAILARRTTLPVRTVGRRSRLDPGCVYVVPASQDVEIIDGWMALKPGAAGAKPSIDLLFRSAARAYGARLIAVVLSGTGSDGAIGARVVHEAGGMVVIQNPETAAFPGMPRSLAPATVDVVAELNQIGAILQGIVSGTHVPHLPEEEQELRGLLADIEQRRGLDFSSYRRGTIVRRLQRRLVATNRQTIAEYRRYASQEPTEDDRLIGTLLIKVTDFFRDARLFSYLRDHVLPAVLERARQRCDGLRIWSAGCATGEEAYSVAILVRELLAQRDSSHVGARIFATDVDPNAIAFARRGVYPAKSLTNVEPDVLSRAFAEVDGEFEIARSIRDLVIFGEHDLGRAAPFQRMDLVLCRNTLMYFTPDLQKRALHGLAYSLREGGYLVLGSAETVRPAAEYFTTEQAQLRVYRRNNIPAPRLVLHGSTVRARVSALGPHGPRAYRRLAPPRRRSPTATWCAT